MAVDIEGYYRTYGPMVLRRCGRLLRDDQKAVDATQDVFVRLLRNERRLRASFNGAQIGLVSIAPRFTLVAGVTQSFYIPNNDQAPATPPVLAVPIAPISLGRVSTWTGGFVGTRF